MSLWEHPQCLHPHNVHWGTEEYFFSLQVGNGGLKWHCGLHPTTTRVACGTESRAIHGLSHSGERVTISGALQESLWQDLLAPGGRWVQHPALCARCGAERPQPAGTSSPAALCNYNHRAAGRERFLQMKRTHIIFLVTNVNYLNTFLPLKATLQDLVKILFQ